MNASIASIARTARCAWRGAGVPSAVTFGVAGGHADGGFGLVVVDAGNPRRRSMALIDARLRAH